MGKKPFKMSANDRFPYSYQDKEDISHIVYVSRETAESPTR